MCCRAEVRWCEICPSSDPDSMCSLEKFTSLLPDTQLIIRKIGDLAVMTSKLVSKSGYLW